MKTAAFTVRDHRESCEIRSKWFLFERLLKEGLRVRMPIRKAPALLTEGSTAVLETE